MITLTITSLILPEKQLQVRRDHLSGFRGKDFHHEIQGFKDGGGVIEIGDLEAEAFAVAPSDFSSQRKERATGVRSRRSEEKRYAISDVSPDLIEVLMVKFQEESGLGSREALSLPLMQVNVSESLRGRI